MSEMEVNKGKLIKVTQSIEEVSEVAIQNLPSYYGSKVEAMKGDASHWGYEWIDGILYKVEFDIERGDMIDEFCELKINEDSSIDFHTYHYNGGAHWSELVDDKLKNLEGDIK